VWSAPFVAKIFGRRRSTALPRFDLAIQDTRRRPPGIKKGKLKIKNGGPRIADDLKRFSGLIF
jgi:hypothetical protein